MPPPESALCRYGKPFRGGTTPIVRYLAGVGSSGLDNLDDVVSFSEVINTLEIYTYRVSQKSRPLFDALYLQI